MLWFDGLNMCKLQPPHVCWKLNPQCNSGGRWHLTRGYEGGANGLCCYLWSEFVIKGEFGHLLISCPLFVLPHGIIQQEDSSYMPMPL
jgi:hypothetical protein